MTQHQYTVVISGAGPAGTATASALVRAGLSPAAVKLFDRCEFPRAKPCGGGLTGRIEQALRAVGLELVVEHQAVREAKVRFGNLQRTVRLERPVSVVRREQFDQSLVEQVRKLGVEVEEGNAIVDYDARRDGVLVRTARGQSIRASVLVGADGVASVVRKRLLNGRSVLPHRLFQAELSQPGVDRSMIFDFTPMIDNVRGYLWVFPVKKNLVNVGLMHYPSSRMSPHRLTQLLREHLVNYGIEAPKKAIRGWPVWGYDPNIAVAAWRTLTVGDAAGINALTGEGIAVAMEQASVAACDIVRALCLNDFRFVDYSRRLREKPVGKELALDRGLAQLVYSPVWRAGLSLALLDNETLKLYGARVDGSLSPSEHARRLCSAALKHAFAAAPRYLTMIGAERSYRRKRQTLRGSEPNLPLIERATGFP